jgi:uncharacterized SAM-binding protein YcdF (DUF218 family)
VSDVSSALRRVGHGVLAGGTLMAWSWLRVARAGGPIRLAQANAIVVFGAGRAGGSPRQALHLRVRRAAELHRQGWAPLVVCSGGEDEIGDMFDLLTEMGVPQGALIADTGGVDTRATVRSVKRLGSRWEQVIVVSSSYHMRRILSECRRQGLRAVSGRPVPERPWWRLWIVVSPARARHILREMVAIWWYALPRHRLRRRAEFSA